MAQSTPVNLRSSLTGGLNLQTQGNGSGRGGPSSNLIVAVTSFGLNALCRGTDFGYRIDSTEVLNWIDSRRPARE